MRIEINGSEFNSSINSDNTEVHTIDFQGGRNFLNENSCFFVSIISFVLAILNLPFGLFMNFSTEFLSRFTEHGLEHWIFALFIAVAIVILLSVLCGTFSIVLFAKSNKKLLHCAGLVIAIISFVLCAVCLGLNIAGMVAW